MASPSAGRQRGKKWALAGISFVVVLGLTEVAGRVLVKLRMEPDVIRMMTGSVEEKGRYRYHPVLPYVPRPNYEDHNSLGFRGPEIAAQKSPSTLRIACVGASTTYGIYVPTEGNYPARLEKLLRDRGVEAEVVNAGVPGYTSQENLAHLHERILPLEPDIVVLYQGRNELFPQAYREFVADYRHYRDPAYDMRATNVGVKRWFARFHTLLALQRMQETLLGFDPREEHPLYGCILRANRPTSEEVVRHLADPERSIPYRQNVERFVAACQERNVKVVLCTLAFLADKLATGNLDNDPQIYPALTAQVDENNAILRSVGEALGVPVVDSAALAAEPDLFHDDCHAKGTGHQKRAELILEALVDQRWLPELAAAGE